MYPPFLSINLILVTSTTDCSSSDADVVFVLDSSGSICDDQPVPTCQNWQTMVAFVHEIATQLNIGIDNTRVGVIVYGSQAQNRWFLNSYNTKTTVLSQIDGLQYTQEQPTGTNLALEALLTEQFIIANGDRSDVQNIAIVITDGKATETALTSQAAAAIENLQGNSNAIKVLAIGVTASAVESEVKEISTQPEVLNQNYWISPSFDQLTQIATAVVSQTCNIISSGKFFLIIISIYLCLYTCILEVQCTKII